MWNGRRGDVGRWAGVVLLCGMAGCGGRPVVRAPERADPVPAFIAAERRVLGDLAVVDGRLEARTRVASSEEELRKAATRLILEEDSQAAIVDGRIDVFSFDARGRALERAAKAIPAAALPERGAGEIERPALERELVLRMLDSERARAKDESSLPRGATDLVRGIVATWSPASSEVRDAWLAKRLEAVRASLGGRATSRAELDELEDALDPLEGLLDANYTQSRAAIAQLRVAIGATSPGAIASWADVWPAVAREVGGATPAEVVARLDAAEKALREGAMPPEATLARVEKLVTPRPRPCRLDGAGSIVRALGAPPERDLACDLVRVAAQGDPEVRAILHAVVAAGLEAIALHGGPVPAPPSSRGTLHGKLVLERHEASRPVDVIVAALAAAWLAPDPKARAARWLAFGDAPLDVVWRELGP